MKYLWLLPLIAVYIVIMLCTWKYSNYALYSRLNDVEGHLTDTAQSQSSDVAKLNAHYLVLATAIEKLSDDVKKEYKYIQETKGDLNKLQYQVDVMAESQIVCLSSESQRQK